MNYTIKRSSRKTLGIYIKSGEVEVRAPMRVSERRIDKFVEKNKQWIQKQLKKHAERKSSLPELTEDETKTARKKARSILQDKLDYWSQITGLEYNQLRLKENSTNWGSCSTKRNINLDWRLTLLPEPICDYVILHEVCHLKEMNHGPRFWSLVERYMPEYRERKLWLTKHGWQVK